MKATKLPLKSWHPPLVTVLTWRTTEFPRLYVMGKMAQNLVFLLRLSVQSGHQTCPSPAALPAATCNKDSAPEKNPEWKTRRGPQSNSKEICDYEPWSENGEGYHKQLAKKERDGKEEGAVDILIKKRQAMNEETMINSYPRENCPASLGIKN